MWVSNSKTDPKHPPTQQTKEKEKNYTNPKFTIDRVGHSKSSLDLAQANLHPISNTHFLHCGTNIFAIIVVLVEILLSFGHFLISTSRHHCLLLSTLPLLLISHFTSLPLGIHHPSLCFSFFICFLFFFLG